MKSVLRKRHRENVTIVVLQCLSWSYQPQDEALFLLFIQRTFYKTLSQYYTFTRNAQNHTAVLNIFVFLRRDWEKSYQTVTLKPLPGNWEKSCRNRRPSRMPRRCFYRHTNMLINSSTLASPRSATPLVQTGPSPNPSSRRSEKSFEKRNLVLILLSSTFCACGTPATMKFRPKKWRRFPSVVVLKKDTVAI